MSSLRGAKLPSTIIRIRGSADQSLAALLRGEKRGSNRSVRIVRGLTLLGVVRTQAGHSLRSKIKFNPTKNTHRAPLFVVALWIPWVVNVDRVRKTSYILLLLYIVQNVGQGFFFLFIQYYNSINRPYHTSKEMHKTNKIPHSFHITSHRRYHNTQLPLLRLLVAQSSHHIQLITEIR